MFGRFLLTGCFSQRTFPLIQCEVNNANLVAAICSCAMQVEGGKSQNEQITKESSTAPFNTRALGGIEVKVVKGGSSKWPKRVKWLLQALGDAAWAIKTNSLDSAFQPSLIESEIRQAAEACKAADGNDAHDCEVCVWRRKDENIDALIRIEKRASNALLSLPNPGLPHHHSKSSPSMAISEANFLVGECFAQVLNVHRPADLNLHLIGSHGQTIWHHPSSIDLIPLIQESGLLKSEIAQKSTSTSSSASLPSTYSSSAPTPSLGKISSTLQIGEASVLASRVEGGATVISNFRPRDVSLGGQGAPLTSTLDYVMAKGMLKDMKDIALEKEIVALQNMGGIGNVTILPPDNNHDGDLAAIAFDTGPANVLLDWFVRKEWNGVEYDENGEKARKGRPSPPALLSHLLSHPYFALPFPKTCGREVFTADLVESWLAHANSHGYSFDLSHECMFESSTELEHLTAMDANTEEEGKGNAFSKEDFLRLLTDVSAASIVLGYLRFTPSLFASTASLDIVPFPSKIFISGGGSHNSFLLERIQHFASLAATGLLAPLEKHVFGDAASSAVIESVLRRQGEAVEAEFVRTNIEPPMPPSPSVLSHSLTGIDADHKESVLFALLAFLTIHAKPSSVPSCTGALSASVLGSITPGNSFLNLMTSIIKS